MFVDGELYVIGRIVDLLRESTVYPLPTGHRSHRRRRLTAGAARLRIAAFTAPFSDGVEELVIIAERATGAARSDPAPAVDAIRTVVSQRHGFGPADIRILPAGAIPRTTSGKLARRAVPDGYLDGSLNGRQDARRNPPACGWGWDRWLPI